MKSLSGMDKRTVAELLEYILQSIDLIQKRTDGITKSDDFLKDDRGLEKLDAVSMRLQSIGEAIKSIHKQNKAVLIAAADEEYWSGIVRLREIISHHYIDIDSEIIFDVCQNELDELKQVIKQCLAASLTKP